MNRFTLDNHQLQLKTILELQQENNPLLQHLINTFKCSKLQSLEDYLKDDARNDVARNINCVYIVYDEKVRLAVGYFSLKSTALIHSVDEDVKEKMIIDNPDAKDFFDGNRDNKKNVHSTTPCVEIVQFAINENYQEYLKENKLPNSKIGYSIFKEIISPLIQLLKNRIGITFIILFAYNDVQGKVIEAYRDMGFSTIEDDELNFFPLMENSTVLRTFFERKCKFMFMPVADIDL